MRLPSVNLATCLAASALLIAGYAAHSLEDAFRAGLPVVQAQSRGSQSHDDPSGALGFQLSGVGPTSTLTLYSPSDHTLYVYPAVTQGDSHVNCSFMLHVARPGAPIERQNCTIGATY